VAIVVRLMGGAFINNGCPPFRARHSLRVHGPLGALIAYTYQSSPWTLLYSCRSYLLSTTGSSCSWTLQRETDDALVALADSIDKRDQ